MPQKPEAFSYRGLLRSHRGLLCSHWGLLHCMLHWQRPLATAAKITAICQSALSNAARITQQPWCGTVTPNASRWRVRVWISFCVSQNKVRLCSVWPLECNAMRGECTRCGPANNNSSWKKSSCRHWLRAVSNCSQGWGAGVRVRDFEQGVGF